MWNPEVNTCVFVSHYTSWRKNLLEIHFLLKNFLSFVNEVCVVYIDYHPWALYSHGLNRCGYSAVSTIHPTTKLFLDTYSLSGWVGLALHELTLGSPGHTPRCSVKCPIRQFILSHILWHPWSSLLSLLLIRCLMGTYYIVRYCARFWGYKYK